MEGVYGEASRQEGKQARRVRGKPKPPNLPPATPVFLLPLLACMPACLHAFPYPFTQFTARPSAFQTFTIRTLSSATAFCAWSVLAPLWCVV